MSFRFLREGKEELNTPGDGSLKSAVYAVLGRDMALGFVPCKGSGEDISVDGFLSKPVCCRGSRASQFFFVNGRYVKSRTMQAALEQAYQNQKMVGRFPGCVLHLTTRLNGVDVNVHPTKTEVKFTSEKKLFDAVYYAAKAALEEDSGAPRAVLEERPKAAPKHDSVTANQTFFPHCHRPAVPQRTAQRRQDALRGGRAPNALRRAAGLFQVRCKAGACQRAGAELCPLCPVSEAVGSAEAAADAAHARRVHAADCGKVCAAPGGGRTPQPRDAECTLPCARRTAEHSRTGAARRRSAGGPR